MASFRNVFAGGAAAALAFLAASAYAQAATLSVPSPQYKTIQRALDVAKPGDVVLVSPNPATADRFWHEQVHVRVAGITLQGQGATLDGTGLSQPDPDGFGYQIGDNGITVEAENVTVTGFTVQNYNYAQPGKFPQPAAGIAVLKQAKSAVINNVCRGNAWGIDIEGMGTGDMHRVANNVATENARSGIFLRGTMGQISVESNAVTRNGLAQGRDGLVLAGVSGAQVRYNTASENGGSGIYVYSDSYAMDYQPVVVENNAANNNGYCGIFADYWAGGSLRSNSVSGNADAGVYLYSTTDVVAQNNYVAQSGRAGIYVEYGYRNQILQNRVENNSSPAQTPSQWGYFGGGINLDANGSGNVVSGNVSQSNAGYDLADQLLYLYGKKQGVNTWTGNTFNTRLSPQLR